MNERINWIDQVKGFAIFLVVYGHNFPITEKYIYSFHMPLFFMVAGFFHPIKQDKNSIVKRIKTILIPYFIWSMFLFVFWLFLGRFYGESLHHNLSPIKNFLGIFYAQGGRDYMDWGIPMWFLPTIFLTFLVFYLIRKVENYYIYFSLLVVTPVVGFLLAYLFPMKYVWSFDVALVSLFFYTIGFYSFNYLKKINAQTTWTLLLISGMIHFILFTFNGKIDMYRSVYSNEFLFIINGVSGTLFYLLLFKSFQKLKFFEFLGKFTIPILALQIRALTLIKLILVLAFGVSVFNFTEIQKLLLSIIQIVIIVPLLFAINKYVPFLNGTYKKI